MGLTPKVATRYIQPVRPAEVRRIRKRLAITQEQFADRLGVHAVTVRKWEAGMQAIRNTHATLMRLIAGQARRRKR
jgi:DNA-binding transcriptional regulator YiaG